MTRLHFRALIALSVTLLSACSSTSNKGRYQLEHDVAPENPKSVEHVQDATPKYEPYSLGGNKDYSLRGERYQIVKDVNGFKQKGIASWYGQKFHGHMTSNGEIYDMYSMSAAHKTLPIPSYVKVTNLDNNKVAIVRINDRGPFHPGRIIDLSYAAAYKLGVIQTGTANVEIETVIIGKAAPESAQETHDQYYIQVSSSKHHESSRTLLNDLSQNLSVAGIIDSAQGVNRVLLGPFDDFHATQTLLAKVKALGYTTAFIKKQALPNKDKKQ